MKPQYEPKTWEQKLGHLIEEAGEVLAAAGKTLRWGLLSVNPELPRGEQETNRAWLRRELEDLEGAIKRIRKAPEMGLCQRCLGAGGWVAEDAPAVLDCSTCNGTGDAQAATPADPAV